MVIASSIFYQVAMPAKLRKMAVSRSVWLQSSERTKFKYLLPLTGRAKLWLSRLFHQELALILRVFEESGSEIYMVAHGFSHALFRVKGLEWLLPQKVTCSPTTMWFRAILAFALPYMMALFTLPRSSVQTLPSISPCSKSMLAAHFRLSSLATRPR